MDPVKPLIDNNDLLQQVLTELTEQKGNEISWQEIESALELKLRI